jgi:hypothetical protein
MSVPVSERALIGRIRRRLKERKQELRVTQGRRAKVELGAFYITDIIDLNTHIIFEKEVDLAKLAKHLGCLKPIEGDGAPRRKEIAALRAKFVRPRNDARTTFQRWANTGKQS